MIDQVNCPFCHVPSTTGCAHLALSVEGRDFVRRCIELSQAHEQWQTLCQRRRESMQRLGEWVPEREDFTWLETAFCEAFMKRLTWFNGIAYEWRSGPGAGEGGFWVLVWSKNPQHLWWELHDEIERQIAEGPIIVKVPAYA